MHQRQGTSYCVSSAVKVLTMWHSLYWYNLFYGSRHQRQNLCPSLLRYSISYYDECVRHACKVQDASWFIKIAPRRHPKVLTVHSNGAAEPKTEKFKSLNREYLVKESYLEPYSAWQNSLETLCITWLKETAHLMKDRVGAPSCREVQRFAGRLLDAYRKNPNKSPNNTLIKLIAENDSFDSDAQRIAEIVVYLLAGHETWVWIVVVEWCVQYRVPPPW